MESSVQLEQITQSMQPVGEVIGTIEEVHGPVVDIVCDHLPPLHQALFCAFDHERYIFETYRHLDERRARAIALHPTAGIRRGLPVYDSGGPVRIPVAPDCLSRMLDVFGAPLDGGAPISPREMRIIIARPTQLSETVPAVDILESGINQRCLNRIVFRNGGKYDIS